MGWSSLPPIHRIGQTMGTRRRFALGATMCIALAGCEAPVSPVAGVVSGRAPELTLRSTSAALKPGDQFSWLDREGNLRCCVVVAQGGARESNSPLTNGTAATVTKYTVRPSDGDALARLQQPVVTIAIAKAARVTRTGPMAYRVELGGRTEDVKVCTTREGLKVTSAATARPADSTHLYYSLGYDVDATCD